MDACIREQIVDTVLLVILCATNIGTLILLLRSHRRTLAAEMTGRFLQQCVNYCDSEHGQLGRYERDHA